LIELIVLEEFDNITCVRLLRDNISLFWCNDEVILLHVNIQFAVKRCILRLHVTRSLSPLAKIYAVFTFLLH